LREEKPEKHISIRTAQKIFEHACEKAGIKKRDYDSYFKT
jgi:predicted solute-binding protein